MPKYEVVSPHGAKVHSGVLKLSEAQAKRHAAMLREVKKNHYEVLRSITFKCGEVIEGDGLAKVPGLGEVGSAKGKAAATGTSGADAEKEAKAIIAEAKKEAKAIIADAKQSAEAMLAEAEQAATPDASADKDKNTGASDDTLGGGEEQSAA